MVNKMSKYKIVKTSDPQLIERFITNAGDSLSFFRYFDSRPYQIIQNHLVTFLLFIPNQKIAVGYGHLEVEANLLWLGIAISEEFRGQGFGKGLLKRLIATGKEENYDYLYLSVDKVNIPAINLYKKFGFELYTSKNELVQIMRLSYHE